MEIVATIFGPTKIARKSIKRAKRNRNIKAKGSENRREKALKNTREKALKIDAKRQC